MDDQQYQVPLSFQEFSAALPGTTLSPTHISGDTVDQGVASCQPPHLLHGLSATPIVTLEGAGLNQSNTWVNHSLTSGSSTPKPNYNGDASMEQTTVEPLRIRTGLQALGRTRPWNGLAVETNMTPGFASAEFPASPESIKGDWVSAASSSDGFDFRSNSLSQDLASPSLPPGSVLRRDGIRKKNARFEIPPERNLGTIDRLINLTTDESEIKELKQQKRLLRNRQAALDSRQRKKQHTERLEVETKQYTGLIHDLQDALSKMKDQETEWQQARAGWVATELQYRECIDSLNLEKEEIVRQHTLETAELRRKNSLLSEQLRRMREPQPALHGQAGSFCDSGVPQGSQTCVWSTPRGSSSLEVKSIEDESCGMAHSALLPSADASPITNLGVAETPSHQSSSGLLLMLLLCGAWFASRSTVHTGETQPAIPEDLRRASATVLNDLYRGGGLDADDQDHNQGQMRGAWPAAVAHPPPLPSSVTGPFDLPAWQEHYVEPTVHQTSEQAFSLTPTQYNHLTAPLLVGGADLPLRPSSRNVGDILAAAASASADVRTAPVAETYTRSLLRDKVPTQVLRDFARMVAQTRPQSPDWTSQLTL